MKLLTYDDLIYCGRIVRMQGPYEYGSIDDLDVHDAAFAAAKERQGRAMQIDVFKSVLKQKLEMPPMFDGMTI